MSASERAAALGSSLDNLITLQAAQIAEWVTNGRPPSFGVDGESYSWSSWLAEIAQAIKDQIAIMQQVSGPFIVRSRGRV